MNPLRALYRLERLLQARGWAQLMRDLERVCLEWARFVDETGGNGNVWRERARKVKELANE